MRLWRRRRSSHIDPATHRAILAAADSRLSAARAFAEEMADWPEPIDVIRDALGLPVRWSVAVGRAWRAVLENAEEFMTPQSAALFAGADSLLRQTYGAVNVPSGMLPIHYEALENARNYRPKAARRR